MNPTSSSMEINAKAAYAAELGKMEAALATLTAKLTAARGNGELSDRIHWGEVADLEHMNEILARAVEVEMPRVE
ncbi:MAG: hypothetical protein DKINENOH_05395 [bacterium]|nr:hypothetical protein [bacterium]